MTVGRELTAGSLFSGIGGLDLAVEQLGYKLRWQIENSEFCNRVLEHHWPNIKNMRMGTPDLARSENENHRLARATWENLPFRDACFDVVICDPPFMAGGGEGFLHTQRYSSNGSYDALLVSLQRAIQEFSRVLRSKGIILLKIMDLTEGRRRRFAHIDIANLWDSTFRLDDLLVKIAVQPMDSPSWKESESVQGSPQLLHGIQAAPASRPPAGEKWGGRRDFGRHRDRRRGYFSKNGDRRRDFDTGRGRRRDSGPQRDVDRDLGIKMAVATEISREMTPAVFSPDRVYRYVLRRRVGLSDGICTFVMLNPSTADEERDDPTVGRCKRFARDWGFGTLFVVNAFAYRATDPRELGKVNDPIGPGNDRAIRDAAKTSGLTVAAWGNGGEMNGRSDSLRSLFRESGVPLYHIGLTASGEPRHPLYVSKDQTPTLWGERAGMISTTALAFGQERPQPPRRFQ